MGIVFEIIVGFVTLVLALAIGSVLLPYLLGVAVVYVLDYLEFRSKPKDFFKYNDFQTFILAGYGALFVGGIMALAIIVAIPIGKYILGSL